MISGRKAEKKKSSRAVGWLPLWPRLLNLGILVLKVLLTCMVCFAVVAFLVYLGNS